MTLTKKQTQTLLEIEKKIGYHFSDIELLNRSLTHRSVHADAIHKNNLHNETLEFLGDAVLSLIAAESLFKGAKYASEGDLSRMRAEYVCKDNLVAAAHRISLVDYMMVSKSLRLSGLMGSSKILSDVVEAIIGAVYLDGGLSAAEKVVTQILGSLPTVASAKEKDAKTALQEKVQHATALTPTYEILKVEGPAHEPIFAAVVKVGNLVVAEASGKSKKDATLASAALALQKIQSLSGEELKNWLVRPSA